MSRKKEADAEITDSEMGTKESSTKQAQTAQPPPVESGKEGRVEKDAKDQQPPIKEPSEAEGEPEQEPCEEEKLKQRIDELEDKLLRVAAEFDNYKKRIARQFEEMIRSANDKILVELLDVVDNFERALQHSNDDTDNTDFEALRKGTELIFNQMTSLLGKYDITPIEAVGQPFDPNLHEALMQVESDEYPEGVVAMEMSRGYKQGNRVLRHSKVGVSKGKPEGEGRKTEG